MIGNVAIGGLEVYAIGIQCGAHRAAGVAGRGRDEDALEAGLAEDARVGDSVERDAAADAEIGEARFLLQRARDVDERVFEHALRSEERRVGKACRSRWSP